MELTHIAIGLGAASLGVAIAIPFLIHKWTKRSTEDTLQLLVNLIVNSAGDPNTVRRLLDDVAKTGEWRGKVSKRSDGNYSIDWKP